MARIKVIEQEEAKGRLAEIYTDIIESRGALAEVHKIQSLRPESILKHMDLYMEIMYSKSELSRATREMIAVIVSAANKCPYCQLHHGEALNKYWRDEAKVRLLREDFTKLDLSEIDKALCKYAHDLTVTPGVMEKEDHTEHLKFLGLSDAAVLDATLVVAYFNFVNRIVLSMGVQIEGHEGKGFKY